MSLAARLINHIQSDGVVHTLGIIGRRLTIYASKYADRYFDRRYGAETSRFVEVAEMAVHSRNKERGIRYEPTRARPFRKLMRSLRFPRGSVFLDIGCGKGRVLIMASECGFGKTVGVEHSRELCRAARRNLDAYRRCTGRRIEAVIHECDALDYRFDDSENVIYLFNPFDAVVLGKVLDLISASLARTPRTIWLIYHNPVWRETIEALGGFEVVGYHSYGGCDFLVYRSGAGPSSVGKPKR